MKSKRLLTQLIEYVELFEAAFPEAEELHLASFITFVQSLLEDHKTEQSHRPSLGQAQHGEGTGGVIGPPGRARDQGQQRGEVDERDIWHCCSATPRATPSALWPPPTRCRARRNTPTS